MPHKDKTEKMEYNRRYDYVTREERKRDYANKDSNWLYAQRYNYVMTEQRRYRDLVKWWNKMRESNDLIEIDGKLRVVRK